MTERRKISCTAVVVIMLLTYQRSLAAYIDPGTGSMMIQAAIATVAAAALIARTYWAKLCAFTRSLFRQNPPDRQD